MIVIADSSALVALSVCQCLPVLEQLFGKVKVPEAVLPSFPSATWERRPDRVAVCTMTARDAGKV